MKRLRFLLCLPLLCAVLNGAEKVFTFEDGTQGFEPDNEQVKVELSNEKSFDGKTRPLCISGAGEYVGASNPIKMKDNDTRIIVIYYAEGFTGDLIVQSSCVPMKKNTHAFIKPTKQGEWAVGEVRLSTFSDWGSKVAPAKSDFQRVQIYGNPEKGKTAKLFLARVAIIDGEDRTAPEAPAGLTSAIKDLAVEIAWPPAKDNVVTARYEVFRGMKPDFEAKPENRVGEVSTLAFRDETLSNFGTYYYRVLPIDAAGNRGPASPAVKIDVAE